MTLHSYVWVDTPDYEGLEAFFNNLELIRQHRDFILADEKYSNISLAGCGAFSFYGPAVSLFIGDLLRLWKETCWKQEDKYFYCIIGSPLSGTNKSKYWSRSEGFGQKNTNTFTKQFFTALCLVQTGSPLRTGDAVPVKVPQRTPSDLTVNELVEILQTFSDA